MREENDFWELWSLQWLPVAVRDVTNVFCVGARGLSPSNVNHSDWLITCQSRDHGNNQNLKNGRTSEVTVRTIREGVIMGVGRWNEHLVNTVSPGICWGYSFCLWKDIGQICVVLMQRSCESRCNSQKSVNSALVDSHKDCKRRSFEHTEKDQCCLGFETESGRFESVKKTPTLETSSVFLRQCF